MDFLFLLHEKLNKLQSSLNADEQITYIVNSLTRILDKFCPLSQVNNKAKPTWITQDIKKHMQKRNMFYKKWIIDPTPTNLEKYKLSRNLTTSLIRNSKLKFYQQKIEKSKNNESIFQAYNDFIQSKTSAKIEVEADVFNQFFAQIGNKLSGKKVNHKIALRHVKSVPNSMVFQEITTKEVFDTIIFIKNKGSSGPDGISNQILKLSSTVISEPLSKLFNQCIKQGTFPNALKIAKVLPFYKDGNCQLPESYRPKSLLNSISKVFEKIIFGKMYKFLRKYRILTPEQYGFQPKKVALMLY